MSCDGVSLCCMIGSYDMFLLWTVAGGQDKGGTSSHLIDKATYHLIKKIISK